MKCHRKDREIPGIWETVDKCELLFCFNTIKLQRHGQCQNPEDSQTGMQCRSKYKGKDLGRRGELKIYLIIIIKYSFCVLPYDQ